MEAAREELVPRVDGGLLRLVHQVELLFEAQATTSGAGLVRLGAGKDPPLDIRLKALILEGPDVAGQPGLLPLAGVGEGGLVVAVPQLPGGGGDPHVLHDGLALGSHLSLVDNTWVFAPAPLHDADRVLPPAIAVLLRQVDGGWGGDLCIVAGHDFSKVWHRAIGKLDCVSV